MILFLTDLNLVSFPVRVLFVLPALLMSSLIVAPYFVHAQFDNKDNVTATSKIGVKITSPKTSQTIPMGQLTIYGTSSDTPETNCQVYVDWNDVKPMQNVTAVGPGGPNDYSNWTFTYTQKYHLIIEGNNELTSKISCFPHLNSDIGDITTRFYSINVTGSNNTSFNIPATSESTGSDTTNIGYHSILPQYHNSYELVNESQNKSQNSSVTGVPDSKTYFEMSSKYTGDNKHDSDKKNSQKIQFHAMSSVMSSKVGKTKNEQNIESLKQFNLGQSHLDLNTYIHNLIKEKLERISERLFR
jgi:hypothetical protein